MSEYQILFASSLVCGALAATAGGLIGPMVVASRNVSMAGAVAHAAVGGIGATLFIRKYVTALAHLDPTWGAFIVGLISAAILSFMQTRKRLTNNPDTGAAALWAIGMSSGLMLAAMAGSYGELEGYLFGQIALNGSQQAWQLGALCFGIFVVLLFQAKRLTASIIDPQHAELQGARPWISQMLLLGMVAIATVALARVVGLVLVLALISLPAVTAKQLSARLFPSIVLSVFIAITAATLPRIAFQHVDISPEPLIVLTAVMLFFLSILYQMIKRKMKRNEVSHDHIKYNNAP